MTKRGYFIHFVDEPSGFAVVATSVREAKKIAYASGEVCIDGFDVEWLDLRAHWQRDANVSDLPIGMVDDPRTGLLHGMYAYLDEYPCDECFMDDMCFAYGGRALCGDCLEKAKEMNNDTV